MKRKLFVLASLLAAVAMLTAVGCKDAKTQRLSVEKSSYTVEYGDTFVMPDVTVDGQNVSAEFTVVDKDGNPVELSYGMFTPEIGTYSVTVSADGYEAITFTVVCSDTTAPTISLSADLRAVLTGTTVVLPEFTVADRSGVDQASVKAELIDPSGTAAQYVGGESVMIASAGQYIYRVSAKDTYGNEGVLEKAFLAQDGNIDMHLSDKQLFNFDDAEYLNLVLRDEADAETQFAVTNVADIKDEYTGEPFAVESGMGQPDGAALAVTVGSDKTAAFSLQMSAQALGQAPICNDTKNVYIRFATIGRFTSMKILHDSGDRIVTVGEVTPYDSEYENQMTWYEVALKGGLFGMNSADAISRIGFEIVNYSKRDIIVYIDEIFYESKPDYTPDAGVVVEFDGEETIAFAESVTYPFGAAGADLSIETDNVPAKNGLSVASALKVATTQHMQGVYITFPDIIEYGYYDAITLSLYSEYLPERLNIGFIDSYGNYSETWCTPNRVGATAHLSCKEGWKEYRFARESYVSGLSGDIIGMYINIYELRDRYFLERYPDFDGTFDLYIDRITCVKYDQAAIQQIADDYMTDCAELGGKQIALFDNASYGAYLSTNVSSEFDASIGNDGAFIFTNGVQFKAGAVTYTPPRVESVNGLYSLKVRFQGPAVMYISDSAGIVHYWNLSNASAGNVNITEDGEWTIAECILTEEAFSPGDNPGKEKTALSDIAEILLGRTGVNEPITIDYIIAVPYTDGGLVSILYDGAATENTYFTTDTFDFDLFTAACDGHDDLTFVFTLKKDGKAISLPEQPGTLTAGLYTLHAEGVDGAVMASGEITFTVAEPETIDVSLTYEDETEFIVNDILQYESLKAESATSGLTYTYTIALPDGTNMPLTSDYTLSQSGTYSITVTGAKRGYIGTATITCTVSPSTTVTGTIAFSGETEVIVGKATDLSGLTAEFDQVVTYEWFMTFGSETTSFTPGEHTFTERGVYTLKAVVTSRGYEGEASLQFTVYAEVADLALLRNNEPASDFKTTKTKAYDLAQFTVRTAAEGAADAILWTLAKDGGQAQPVDMSASAYTFGENGTYTLTATPDRAQYFTGTPVSLTITVEDLRFGTTDETGRTIWADFSNEGENVAVETVGNVTLSVTEKEGVTALRAESKSGWSYQGFRVFFPQAVTINPGQSLFLSYYKESAFGANFYINSLTDGTTHYYTYSPASGGKVGVWDTASFSYEDMQKTWDAGTTEITKLLFRPSAASVLYLGEIWIAETPEEDALADFPENGVLLKKDVGTFTAGADWGSAVIHKITLEETVTIYGSGSIAIRFKHSAAASLYIGFNTMTDSALATLDTKQHTEFTVVTVKIADNDNLAAAVGEELTVTQLLIRQSPVSGAVAEIDWIAFVPGE